MKYFQQIGFGIDVGQLVHALKLREDLWNSNPLRQTFIAESPHREVDDIWIRFNDTAVLDEAAIIDGHESIWYPPALALPQVRPLLFWLAARVEAERIGRVLVTKLAPGARIYPHVDGGDHATYYERYHIVLQSLPGSMFRAGDEWVHMNAGECWWFQNGVEHEVVNNSADDRIHLIIDLRVTRLGT